MIVTLNVLRGHTCSLDEHERWSTDGSCVQHGFAERDPLHQGLIVERANLKARDRQIDLAANLNKTQVVSLTSSLSQQAGYYCSVCDCVLKDSVSYLDHINGKYHNRSLGMSMRVEQSTPDQVRVDLRDGGLLGQHESTVCCITVLCGD